MLGDGLPCGVVEGVEGQEAHLASGDCGLGQNNLAQRESGWEIISHVFDRGDILLFPPRDIQFRGEGFEEWQFHHQFGIEQGCDRRAL